MREIKVTDDADKATLLFRLGWTVKVIADGVSGRKVSEEDEIYMSANSMDCMFICCEI